jgi:SpoIID/LytB domain protein
VLSATVLGLSVGATACADGATPQPLPAGTTFTITGHGNGHGHGLSQWGAQGAATKGLSAAQILAFYYPGTRTGSATGQIRVRLTDHAGRRVVVQSRPGLVADTVGASRSWNLGALRPRATRWRIVPVGGGRSRLDFLRGRWQRFRTVPRDLEFHAAGNAPIRLYLPDGSAEYRGIVRSASPVRGRLDRVAVNVVSLESYLKGVVPAEAYPSWKPAALQAQAVAARSYAAYQRAHEDHGYYDVVDTTADQAYLGVRVETASTDAAVDATVGRVLTYDGEPAFTQFSASNGGAMLGDGAHPYLVSKADPYTTSDTPYFTWTKTLTLKQLQARFPSYTPIADVRVTATYEGHWVRTVTVTSTSGKKDEVSGDAIRSWADLRSSNFTITVDKPPADAKPTKKH